MGKLQRVCRLCLEKCVDFKALEDYMKDVLDILLLKINLAVCEEPITCGNCAAMLMRCFDFKAACFYAHDFIAPFLDDEKISKLDLRKVFMSKHKTFDIPDGHGVCGFCMGLATKCTAVSLDNEEGDVMLKKWIEKCLPELDFSTIEEPMICAPCYESLKTCYHFVTSCLIVEEKIMEYRKLTGADVIEIADVPQSTFRNGVKVEEGSMIRTDKKFYVSMGNADEQVGHEHLSFVRMEEQKFLLNENVEIKTDQYDFDGCLVSPQPECSESRGGPLKTAKKHKLVHNFSKARTYQCDLCPVRTKYLQSLKKHQKLHGNPKKTKVYCCDCCSYQAKSKAWFKRHSLKHKNPSGVLIYWSKSHARKFRDLNLKDTSEKTIYQCDSCLFQTKDEAGMRKHIVTHKLFSETIMYQCGTCAFQTKDKGGLTKHMVTHKTTSETIMYQCDSCDFKTKYKRSLDTHRLMHKDASEVKLYQCDSCHFKTKHKHSLIEHMLTHKDPSEITMLQCDYCSFQTKHERYIRRHMVVHKPSTETTMYQCDLCSYETKYKANLRGHLTTHKLPSKIKMHQCDLCSFKTKYKRVLPDHMKIHKLPSETTMYQCDLCSFKTKYKRVLPDHMITHKLPSETTMYQCESCSFQTKYKRCIHKHGINYKHVVPV